MLRRSHALLSFPPASSWTNPSFNAKSENNCIAKGPSGTHALRHLSFPAIGLRNTFSGASISGWTWKASEWRSNTPSTSQLYESQQISRTARSIWKTFFTRTNPGIKKRRTLFIARVDLATHWGFLANTSSCAALHDTTPQCRIEGKQQGSRGAERNPESGTSDHSTRRRKALRLWLGLGKTANSKPWLTNTD